MRKTAAEIWWEDIAGPAGLAEKTINAVLQSNSVFLLCDAPLAWAMSLRGSVEAEVCSRNLAFNDLDAQEWLAEEEIDVFLVKKLCPQHATGYLRTRSAKGQGLRESGLLANTVIWVRNLRSAAAPVWMNFVSAYRGRTLQDGVFVLELEEPAELRKFSQRIVLLQTGQDITKNDLRLFLSILARRAEAIPAYAREYAVGLCSALAWPDAELGAALLKQEALAAPPLECLKAVWHEQFLEDARMQRCAARPEHPVYRLENGEEAALERAAWAAQLETAFPLIERERLILLERWRPEIEAALDTEYWEPQSGKTGTIQHNGLRLESIFEVEIGTLVYMMTVRRKDDHTQYLLYLPEEAARARLHLLHRMRNKLAHLEQCAPEDMAALLSGHGEVMQTAGV